MPLKVSLPIILSVLLLTACHKKPEEPASVETAPASAVSTQAPVAAPQKSEADMTDAEKEMAAKQLLMDYATMEDSYINDPKAQWATAAKASSTFGDDNGRTPADSNLANNASGKVDGKVWTNNNQEIGFDWIELTYDKPVAATEVRLVIPNGDGAEGISKVELQDSDGKWNTIWSGISDVKKDQRGGRTWFVRKFDKTAYQVKAVKYTIANNLYHGYKVVDAAQLVGE